MKKRVILFLSIGLTLLIIVACGQNSSGSSNNIEGSGQTNEGKNDTPQDANSSEVYTLKFSSGFNLNHPASIEGDQFFIDRIEDLSEGRINVEFYPEAQLGAISDATSQLQNGIADIALVIPSYESSKYPLSGVFSLPLAAPNGDVATKVFNDIITDTDSMIFKNDYQKNNILPLASVVFPPYEIVTRGNNKIESIEDLKGLKIRNAGGSGELLIEALGATSVHVVNAEQYIALERGTIDGGIYELPFILSLKIDEVTNHITTNANLNVAPMLLGMNTNTFNELPEDLQQVLIQAGEETTENIRLVVDNYKEDAISFFEEAGHTTYEFTDEQLEQIKTMTEPVWDDWTEQMNAQGLPGKEAVDEYFKYLDNIE